MANLASMTAVRYGTLALTGPMQGWPSAGHLPGDARPVLDGLDALAGELHALSALGVRTETALALLETTGQLLRDAGPEIGATRVTQGGLAGWQIRAVTRYIDNNLDSKLSLATLAATVRLSASYLCRAFRHSLQCSPMQYVMQRRLLAAKNLLRNSPTRLSEIALACGFADQAHFTRLFRSANGETPQRWRRMWQATPMPGTGALHQSGAQLAL